MIESRRGWKAWAAGAIAALATRIAIAGVAGLLFACTREYESPYLPGSGSYAGDDWTRDGDGDGVADSVAKYAPECDKEPKLCIEDAKVVSRIGSEYRVAFGDMILWQGSTGTPARATWTPEEASARGYRLYSSDTAKVKIREGRMDAVGVGNAQITVALNGESVNRAFLVRVVAKEGRKVLGITAGDLTVDAGSVAVPEITWNPPDAEYKDYTLDVEVPSVGWAQGGAIKTIFAGTTRVTVETQDGGHKALFTLKVNDTPQRIEAVSIAADDMYLVVGDTDTPIIHWNPHNVTEKRYLLAPADTTVASVDKDRDRIVAVSTGRTQVNVYSLDGGNRTTYFTVSVAATAVPVQGLQAADMKLTVGSSPAFPRLSWIPVDATNRKFTLVSDSPHVASVEGSLIIPMSLGLATLRAVAADGGFEAPFLVQVQPQDTAIHVDSVRVLDISLTVGYERAPLVTWYPEDAGNQAYTMVSADPAIASINGVLVRGEKGGNTTVTVTTADGGKTTTFKVNVVSAHIPVQRLQGEDMDMVVGEIESPALSWFPGNATDLSYSLTTDNPAVVRIVDSTSVEAAAVGTARVIVRSKDGPADTLQVTVSPFVIRVTGIVVAALTHNVGDPPKDVTPLIQWTPTNATDKTFKLISSSNTSALALVDNKLHAVASGTAQVVIESQDAARLKDTFTVTVRQPVKGVAVRDTSVWPGSADIDPGRLITWTPANADNKEFALTSLDTTVASIIGGNRVRPKVSGAANVILKSVENPLRLDTFKVTVMVPVKSLTIRDTTVLVGMKLINPAPLVTWNPSNATDKNWFLLWVGAPTKTVIDSVTWRFNAVGPGKVSLIYVSSQNNLARDTFAITVIQPVTNMTAANLTLRVGDPDAWPSLTWTPANASDKGYTLTGGTAGIATAVAGKVHAEGPGVSTFTAKSTDGGKLAIFTVTVTQPVASITVANVTMKVGDPDLSLLAHATILPANASDKTCTISGGTAGVATIVAGKIHAEGPGTATFTLKTNDGGKTATSTVTVTQPVVSITAANIGLTKGGADVDPVITWNPANASNKGFSLSGGNSAIAIVAGAKVRPVGGGSTTFTVTTADGAKSATFTATVAVPVTGVDCSDISMRTWDNDEVLPIQWSPADATNKNYTLTSSETSNVLIVNGNMVRPVSRGESTITVTSQDGGKVGTCVVDVN